MKELFEENRKPSIFEEIMPSGFSDVIGHNDVISVWKKLLQAGEIPSEILYGPPGCGKTALAFALSREVNAGFVYINAPHTSLDELRQIFKKAELDLKTGRKTLLFLDEIHRLDKGRQDFLLYPIEKGTIVFMGATTTNPYHYITAPLRSRVTVRKLKKLNDDDLKRIISRVLTRTGKTITKEAEEFVVKTADGDARKVINIVYRAGLVSSGEIGIEDVKSVSGQDFFSDSQVFYDLVSAFIKSIRGSDPDSALYYLARLLRDGADPVYIARRLVILSAEDVGLAEPLALPIAQSGLDAVEKIGLPEAEIILAEITVFLSLLPKSNSSFKALQKAKRFVEENQDFEIPHDLTTSGKHLYRSPHDYPNHIIPDFKYTSKQVQFYTAGKLGREKKLSELWESIKKKTKP